ncbi:hypothetical protein [Streptomyces phytophilus]|uniref:hypothetical protein n=1 Tax=Streptomyces phytophilus TaxID=722715 RepID=UPI0015EFEA2F|nr:hypothetical protein [Streptomyces phytophilus]
MLSPPAPPRPAAHVQADIAAWLKLPVAFRVRLDPRREVLPGLWAEWLAADRAEVVKAA